MPTGAVSCAGATKVGPGSAIYERILRRTMPCFNCAKMLLTPDTLALQRPHASRGEVRQRARLAAPDPSDPAETELLPGEDLAQAPRTRRGRDQELGLRASRKRAGARGPELGAPRDCRGRRRRLSRRGAL